MGNCIGRENGKSGWRRHTKADGPIYMHFECPSAVKAKSIGLSLCFALALLCFLALFAICFLNIHMGVREFVICQSKSLLRSFGRRTVICARCSRFSHFHGASSHIVVQPKTPRPHTHEYINICIHYSTYICPKSALCVFSVNKKLKAETEGQSRIFLMSLGGASKSMRYARPCACFVLFPTTI